MLLVMVLITVIGSNPESRHVGFSRQHMAQLLVLCGGVLCALNVYQKAERSRLGPQLMCYQGWWELSEMGPR